MRMGSLREELMMICLYCNTEYSLEDPCFCHPAPQKSSADPEAKPAMLVPLAEKNRVAVGLDNASWKPDTVPRHGPARRSAKRVAPGPS